MNTNYKLSDFFLLLKIIEATVKNFQNIDYVIS
jgi:hypothetical protein